MHYVDWIIVGGYLLAMLGLAVRLGHRQHTRRDYFLGANGLRPASLATSTIATQCSTNSLMGAPAFVGFVSGGGLLWLQYELAVPLAMLLLIWLLGSIRKAGHISIYGFLQDRLGSESRLLASSMFLIFRGIATGVTVYGVAVMVTLIIDVSYTQAVLLFMAITIVYDVLGGMRAVVISDVVQMILIVATIAVSLWMLGSTVGGFEAMFTAQPVAERAQALQFSWGLTGDGDYGFWPMLIGGLFLYMAYYGCDQSQAQRVLSSRNERDAERILVLNGLLRFPLVFLYCLLGLALGLYAAQQPEFISSLPQTQAGAPNYNLVFPSYVLQAFPVGVVGLVIAGILAAAMSSIDSSLNALSASTIEDHLARLMKSEPDERRLFRISKLVTLFWGLFAMAFSYQVEAIAPTVLEVINKIGSLANGPLLALFTIALLAPGVGQRHAITGFFSGLICNFCLWAFAPQVSWLWWNVTGCIIALATAALGTTFKLRTPDYTPQWASVAGLGAMAVVIFAICLAFGIRA